MAKTLKSKIQNKLWEKYKITSLPLKEIWPSVPFVDVLPTISKPFKQNLYEDIKENGMHFPIMVVQSTGSQLIQAKAKFGDKINNLPFWTTDQTNFTKTFWSCWGGSQRIDVAQRLGFTHISCAIMPTIEIARSLQKQMRQPFLQTYYEN